MASTLASGLKYDSMKSVLKIIYTDNVTNDRNDTSKSHIFNIKKERNIYITKKYKSKQKHSKFKQNLLNKKRCVNFKMFDMGFSYALEASFLKEGLYCLQAANITETDSSDSNDENAGWPHVLEFLEILEKSWIFFLTWKNP